MQYLFVKPVPRFIINQLSTVRKIVLVMLSTQGTDFVKNLNKKSRRVMIYV